MKRGQLQLQESMFVVFIFFIILAIGLIVFYQFESRNIDKIQESYEEDKYYYLLSYLPSMPELQYSRFGFYEECIDLKKAKSFSDISEENKECYRKLFGRKRIILDELVLYNFFDDEELEGRRISSPICVYDSGKYLVEKLEVVMYE